MTQRTDGRRIEPAPGTRHPTEATPADGEVGSTPGKVLPSSKFTVLLDHDAAADFDQLALDIRRQLGRRVSKGELVRALLTRATKDPVLRDDLLDELRAPGSARA